MSRQLQSSKQPHGHAQARHPSGGGGSPGGTSPGGRHSEGGGNESQSPKFGRQPNSMPLQSLPSFAGQVTAGFTSTHPLVGSHPYWAAHLLAPSLFAEHLLG